MTGLKRTNHGRGHGYKLDGKKVDGVTTLISNGMPKPALMYWSARTVAEFVADTDPQALEVYRALGRDGFVKVLKDIPWRERDRAAVRGTKVHGYAERIVNGEVIPENDDTLPIWGFIESCVGFMNDWRPAPVLVESVVGSRTHQYAGTLDLVADLPDGRRAVIDYKTGASGVWPEVALQLAAYRYAEICLDQTGAETQMSTLGIDCAYAVWLRADGYDVIPIDTGRHVFEMFKAVAYVAKRIEGMRAWVKETEHWKAGVAA